MILMISLYIITRDFGFEKGIFNGQEVFIIINDVFDDVFDALLLLLCIINVILFVLNHKSRRNVIIFVFNHTCKRRNVIIFVFDHSYHKFDMKMVILFVLNHRKYEDI